MTMFGTGGLGTSSSVFGSTTTASTANPMKDIEVVSPPDDSVSCLEFSPPAVPQTFLVAGSWDNNVSTEWESRWSERGKKAQEGKVGVVGCEQNVKKIGLSLCMW